MSKGKQYVGLDVSLKVTLLGGAAPLPTRHAPASMKRRVFLNTLAMSAALLPFDGLAQTPSERRLIGRLFANSKAVTERWRGGFLEALQELGYMQGRDYAIVERYADFDYTRLPLLADELVGLQPAVMVTDLTIATLAAKQASASIPIVGAFLTDPVRMGLAASEARPGSNVTGVLTRVEGLPAKLMEIARDLIPAVAKIGALVNPANPVTRVQHEEAAAAAAKMGVSFAPVEVRAADEVGPAFQILLGAHAGIAIVFGDAMLFGARRQIAAFALASRLPIVCSYREFVEEGGLISYGINLHQNYRRTAYFVDRILKGERPADLPLEFPTNLEFVINLATAKAIGLDIPAAVLARADEVIE